MAETSVAVQRLAQLKAALSHPVEDLSPLPPNQKSSAPWKPRDRPFNSTPPVKVRW